MEKEAHRAYFAAGCFWGVEESFLNVEGVLETRVGYSGGDMENPTYEQVCGGDTGHAETTEVLFDPEKITYEELVRIFFVIHNPTTLNRQGADVGAQYRSVIFYLNDTQKMVAENVKELLMEEGTYGKNIVTEITPFTSFYPAEEYHQKYTLKQKGIYE